VTWHAARFLLIQAMLLAVAAAFAFGAWLVLHRGHALTRHWKVHIPIRIALGFIIVAASLLWFTTILRGVLTDGKVVAADHRLHNTLRLFQSQHLHLFYSTITDLASTAFVVPVAILLAGLFWMHHRKHEAILFVVAIAGAMILEVILKYIVRRPRPPDALAFMSGPSFPSGHTLAATAVYGMLIFLLLREKPRTWWHIVAVVPLFALIVLVPISRVYLGVHWPHDVIASVDLGCAWLACLTMLVRFRGDGTRRDPVKHRIREWPFAIVATAIVAYAILLACSDVQREARPLLAPPRAVADTFLSALPDGLHRTSEDLIGGPMEPLSFLFVGTAADLERAFEAAGWFRADLPSVHGLAKELLCVIADRADPHGPATPAYYGEQPQDLTFERPGTPSGSIRHRHHIRIWREPICFGAPCTPLWGATCSYDMGIEFVPKPYLLTHRIDPQVDHEREFVAQTLRSAGAADLRMITITGPRRGKNAGGDAFITDGRAHVMRVGRQ
jgi:membrane-associated phospholipid phosphatase